MRLWMRGRKDGPWCLDVAGVVGQGNKQGSRDRRKSKVRLNPMDLQRLGRVGCTVVRWMSVPLSVASPRVQCGSRVHGFGGNWAVKADAVIRDVDKETGVKCQTTDYPGSRLMPQAFSIVEILVEVLTMKNIILFAGCLCYFPLLVQGMHRR